MKVILVLIAFFVASCGVEVKDVIDYLELEREVPATTSIIPVDTTIPYDNSVVIEKAKTYIASSYRPATSRHYDSYGLLLPLEDGIFKEQGDAIGWNMISLQTMCMIQKAYTQGKLTDPAFDMSSDITQLWNNIKSSVIKPEGYIIRHPETTRETSISKDHMTMFIGSLGYMKHLGCSPVVDEAAPIISRFIEYGRSKSWEMGEPGKTDPTTTYLTSRHPLYELNNLYGLNYTREDLSLSTSAESTNFNTVTADFINENRYYCRLGYAGSCLRIANTGVYGNHLTFVSSILFYIASNTNQNTVYTLRESSQFLINMAKVGQSIGYPNWLFVAAYRHFILGDNATYNDINKHLTEDWPNDLPSERNPVNGWGSSDFLWQRVPYQTPNGSTKEYIGTDFLLLFAYTIL